MSRPRRRSWKEKLRQKTACLNLTLCHSRPLTRGCQALLDAGGVTEISRWWSEAKPPANCESSDGSSLEARRNLSWDGLCPCPGE
jgi:hypothetical protein